MIEYQIPYEYNKLFVAQSLSCVLDLFFFVYRIF